MVGIVILVLIVTPAGYLRLGPIRQSPSQLQTRAVPYPSYATAQFKDFQAVTTDSASVFMMTLDGEPLLYASSDVGRNWQAIGPTSWSQPEVRLPVDRQN